MCTLVMGISVERGFTNQPELRLNIFKYLNFENFSKIFIMFFKAYLSMLTRIRIPLETKYFIDLKGFLNLILHILQIRYPYPIYVTQINIYETYICGRVSRILLNNGGIWQVVWNTSSNTDVNYARIFTTDYFVRINYIAKLTIS